MFRGIEHTAMASPDPEKLAQWYVDHLGFRINYRFAGNVFVRAPNGGMIEFIPSEGERAAQRMTEPGIRHMAIEVDDIEAAHRHLQAEGVRFLTELREIQGNRLIFFADGDGNFLHLIKRPAPLP